MSGCGRVGYVVLVGLLAAGSRPAQAQRVVEVQLAPPRLQMRAGDQVQVVATGYGEDGAVIVGTKFRWSSTDSNVVEIVVDTLAPEIARLMAVGSLGSDFSASLNQS